MHSTSNGETPFMSQSVSIPLKGQSREMVYFLIAKIEEFFIFCSYL
jgi:hypothetical protein